MISYALVVLLTNSHLKLTHADDDHIGNASHFLAKMASTDETLDPDKKTYTERVNGCCVTYSAIPNMYYAPKVTKVTMSPAHFKKDTNQRDGGEVNGVQFEVEPLEKAWIDQMNLAGIRPATRLVPMHDQTNDIEINKTNNV